MERATKESWLQGAGDLREADVEDCPAPGQSVRVRALSARYSAEVQGQLKLVQDGREQVAKIDVPTMERLQFQYGCIDPQFTADEAIHIQEKWGPEFRKVVAKIDELSGIDKEAIEAVEQRFRDSGAVEDGSDGDLGAPAGSGGPAVPLRASA